MPDNVIDLTKRLAPAAKDDGDAFDAFLVAEGLELIAAYRAIEDETVRKSVVHLLVSLGAASKPNAPY